MQNNKRLTRSKISSEIKEKCQRLFQQNVVFAKVIFQFLTMDNQTRQAPLAGIVLNNCIITCVIPNIKDYNLLSAIVSIDGYNNVSEHSFSKEEWPCNGDCGVIPFETKIFSKVQMISIQEVRKIKERHFFYSHLTLDNNSELNYKIDIRHLDIENVNLQNNLLRYKGEILPYGSPIFLFHDNKLSIVCFDHRQKDNFSVKLHCFSTNTCQFVTSFQHFRTSYLQYRNKYALFNKRSDMTQNQSMIKGLSQDIYSNSGISWINESCKSSKNDKQEDIFKHQNLRKIYSSGLSAQFILKLHQLIEKMKFPSRLNLQKIKIDINLKDRLLKLQSESHQQACKSFKELAHNLIYQKDRENNSDYVKWFSSSSELNPIIKRDDIAKLKQSHQKNQIKDINKAFLDKVNQQNYTKSLNWQFLEIIKLYFDQCKKNENLWIKRKNLNNPHLHEAFVHQYVKFRFSQIEYKQDQPCKDLVQKVTSFIKEVGQTNGKFKDIQQFANSNLPNKYQMIQKNCSIHYQTSHMIKSLPEQLQNLVRSIFEKKQHAILSLIPLINSSNLMHFNLIQFPKIYCKKGDSFEDAGSRQQLIELEIDHFIFAVTIVKDIIKNQLYHRDLNIRNTVKSDDGYLLIDQDESVYLDSQESSKKQAFYLSKLTLAIQYILTKQKFDPIQCQETYKNFICQILQKKYIKNIDSIDSLKLFKLQRQKLQCLENLKNKKTLQDGQQYDQLLKILNAYKIQINNSMSQIQKQGRDDSYQTCRSKSFKSDFI